MGTREVPRAGVRTLLGLAAALGLVMGLVSRPGTQEAGDVFRKLGPGEWYEVPNSRMREVCPPGAGPSCQNVMAAWSGGAYDTKRDRLIVWGGGHADYWGNEVYVFEIKTLRWRRLNDPYWPARQMTNEQTVSVYPDGSPSSRHTYDGLEYLPIQDKLWVNGGSRWPSGTPDKYTGWFDFETLRWERKADSPSVVLAGVSAYDPLTGHVFQYERGWLGEYDPVADAWTTRGADSWYQDFVGEIDPVERKFVMIGNGLAFVYDLRRSGRIPREPLGAIGDTEIQQGRPSGLAYDARTKRLLAWKGGADVYALDLTVSPPRWERRAPAPTNRVIPKVATRAGIYGRWRYVPSKDVFIGVGGVDENVYLYRSS